MKYLRIKNWKKHQHYTGRTPPWIKLHTALLDDYGFECLTDINKIQLVAIWLLASRSREFHSDGDPILPHDESYLFKKSGLKTKIDLAPLISSGFIICYQSASTPLAPCKQLVPTETETYKEETYKEETEGEKEEPLSGKPNDAPPYDEIISHLNKKAGTAFRASGKGTRSHIHARWKEGFTLEQFRIVINKKCAQWKYNPDMDKYLRPQTLFAGNFESYLNEKEVKGNGSGNQGVHGSSAQAGNVKARPGKYAGIGTSVCTDASDGGTDPKESPEDGDERGGAEKVS